MPNPKPYTIADYFSLYKQFHHELFNEDTPGKKRVKIAVLSSFNIRGIREILFVECYLANILADIYVGGYNQHVQEIIDPHGNMSTFAPQIIFLFIDTRSVAGDYYLDPYVLSEERRRIWADQKVEEIKYLMQKAKERFNASIIVHNLETPVYSSMGILENKQGFGFQESITYINSMLRDICKQDSSIFVFDYDSFLSRLGKDRVFNSKMYYLGDMKLDLHYMPALCKAYLAYIKPFVAISRKCLVLDLDNTLWGGIIGEDGIEGIQLGPTTEGRPFMEFQRYILSLYKRGIILAINSKNNRDDALEGIQNHPYSILREKHFASIRINWGDKVTNMLEIADELNIGIDSFVFIDDDVINREMIKKALPEVAVIDLPDDPALYLETLMAENHFHTLQITDEDRKRGQVYADQRRREDSKSCFTNLDEFLAGLEMKVTIERDNPLHISRISQLTMKTNQFNMTTKRYSEEKIREFTEHKEFIVFSVAVNDKFGDNGISGVAIVETSSLQWRLDTFLLSCRVIGRRVEEAVLVFICDLAREKGAERIKGEFIETVKNQPARDFYGKFGFCCSNTNTINLRGEGPSDGSGSCLRRRSEAEPSSLADEGGRCFAPKVNDINSNTENPVELWEYDLSVVREAPEFIKIQNSSI